MTFDNPPVIICGAHGGGTSYVTKMLRYAGFFAGWDAGSIRARKFHESGSFKAVNYALGEHAGDRDLLAPAAIERVERELDSNRGAWIDLAREYVPQIRARYGKPTRAARSAALALAWACCRLYPHSQWCWPGYLSWRLGIVDPEQPWGWKDPRNSITLPLWKELFPRAQVLLIEKRPSGNEARSPSGAWFRNPSNRAEIDRYLEPEVRCESDVMRISFEDATSNVSSFNALLGWLGLPALSRRQFSGLLAVTGYEG